MDSVEPIARDAIRDLVAQYAVAADRGRFDTVVDLFAADGTIELPEGRIARGHDGIRAFLTGTGADLRAATKVPLIRHHVTTHEITLTTPTAATGRVYFLVVTERGLDHWGTYRDDYVHVNGAWRFAKRRVTIDGRAPGSWSAERTGR
jgi:hypothetical protein